MLMATVNQGYVFLCTVGAGVAMGVLYDGVRILRRTLHLGRVLTFLLDLVYWAVVLVVALFAVLYANEGEVRPFTILGFALGCALYLIGFSPIVLGLSLIHIWRASRMSGLRWAWFCSLRRMTFLL